MTPVLWALLSVVTGSTAAVLSRDLVQRQTPPPTLQWGSIGDSWCSGIAYNDDVAYDDNADHCLRTWEAWSWWLEGDTSWTAEQFGSFKGCTGSTLGDMHGYGQFGKQLINQIPGSPQVIFMQAGGNDCDFGDIARNCVFQPYFDDYGLNYADDPDCTGTCCQSLQNAENYINQQGDGGLAQDLLNTINDIMTTPQANNNDPFYLYVIGYPRLFDASLGGTYSCDSQTFAPWWKASRPPLTQALRQRMNDLIVNFNNVYEYLVDSWVDVRPVPQQFTHFVSVDEWFEGHRFCEASMPYDNAQWYSTDVWFWNLQQGDHQEDTSTASSDTLDPLAGVQQSDVDAGIGLSIENALVYNVSSSSGGGGDDGPTPADGWKYRPFHPKWQGHWMIAQKIKADMCLNGMPLVTCDPAAATVTPTPPAFPLGPPTTSPTVPPASTSEAPSTTDGSTPPASPT